MNLVGLRGIPAGCLWVKSSSQDGRLVTKSLTMWGRRGGNSRCPHCNIAGDSSHVWEVRIVPVLKCAVEQRDPAGPC